MRSVAEHQQAVRELIRPLDPVRLPLPDAAGLVLAHELRAERPLPGFDNSAMDGYAVRAADVAAASRESPVVLPVAADIPAGRVDQLTLAPGTAARIMTGAPLPADADTIVQVEATDAGADVVTVFEPRDPGMHVRRAGEDVSAGDVVLAAGQLLGPAQLALAAALGYATVPVFPAPRVVVLSTGSELVAPGEDLRHGQIHESNGVMLAVAVRAAGAHAEQLHFVADDVAAFAAAMDELAGRADVVVTSGGVSAGAYEVVKDALTGQGVDFVKVAMQPGMPQGVGRYRGVPVVTLPGNPVSSFVSFEVFVRPALRAAMHRADVARPVVRARLAEPLRSPAGRRQYRRGVLDRASATVRPLGPPGSHFLRWMASSDCLLDIPEDVTELGAGDEVEAWVLDDYR